MRNSKRIPIVLQIMKDWKILSKFLKNDDHVLKKNIYEDWKKIEKEWIENPDLRFGQLLCNMRFIDTIYDQDKIWNIEEDQWLIDNNYLNMEDISFWGVNFDIDGKKLPKVQYKLLKDLTLEHIKNIIIFFERQNGINRIISKYLEYFNQRIKNNE